MDTTPASPKQIRDFFLVFAEDQPNNEVAYRDLWAALLEAGLTVRGSTPKRQQDAVYGALKAAPGLIKVRPGVFARKAEG